MALKEDNHSTVSTMTRQQVPHERVVSTTATLTTEYGETMIKVNKGDMSITQLYEEVLEPLLLGAGYSKETIDSLFEC